MTLLRLKVIGRDEDYPPEICAAARCEEEAVIVDATRLLSACQLPLCEYHWQVRCEVEEDEPEEMIIEIVERSVGPPPSRPRRVAEKRRVSDERQLTLPLG